MKVAIVHDYITKVGGAQNVLKVLHSIFPQAPIYTLLYDKNGTKNEFEGCEIHTSSLQNKPAFLRKRIKLLLKSFPKAIEEFDFSDYDLVISSSNSFAHGIITRPSTLHVCYCYSPMRYAWDWHSEYLVENKIDSGILSIAVQKILKGIREWDFLASKRVDEWIAISQTVQKRISKYYRADSTVIYPPANIAGLLNTESKAGDYYLIISTLTPYKKIDLAIEAFNANGKKLIIAGEGGDRGRLESLVKKDNIEFSGFITDEKKVELLRGCRAFIFPGEEDFGLAPVEAMACGKPVVGLNKGGLAESVTNHVTGCLFDEPSSDSLNEAIDWLDNNYHNIKPEDCRLRAQNFSEAIFIAKFRHYIDKAYKKYHER